VLAVHGLRKAHISCPDVPIQYLSYQLGGRHLLGIVVHPYRIALHSCSSCVAAGPTCAHVRPLSLTRCAGNRGMRRHCSPGAQGSSVT
jgi:hypothetical protein